MYRHGEHQRSQLGKIGRIEQMKLNPTCPPRSFSSPHPATRALSRAPTPIAATEKFVPCRRVLRSTFGPLLELQPGRGTETRRAAIKALGTSGGSTRPPSAGPPGPQLSRGIGRFEPDGAPPSVHPRSTAAGRLRRSVGSPRVALTCSTPFVDAPPVVRDDEVDTPEKYGKDRNTNRA